jgi:hypothetical protein
MTVPVRLGLRANAGQFALLVGLNALVGAMVGLERSVLPPVGEEEFALGSTAAILAFIVAFGVASAFSLPAGSLRFPCRCSSDLLHPGRGSSPPISSSA